MRYKGPVPVTEGQTVEVLFDEWEPVVVQSALASQFTYERVRDAYFGFEHYASAEWRHLK